MFLEAYADTELHLTNRQIVLRQRQIRNAAVGCSGQQLQHFSHLITVCYMAYKKIMSRDEYAYLLQL